MMRTVTGWRGHPPRSGLLLAVTLGLAACGGSEGPTQVQEEPEVPEVWVEPVRSTVEAGSSVQLVGFVRDLEETFPEERTVSWSSSSDAIATVSSTGLVTGVANGTVTITATETDGGEATAQVTIGSGGLEWEQVVNGGSHRCGVTTSGEAYCWGDGRRGRLGNGASNDSPIPVPVTGGHTFTTLAAGEVHTCGVTTSGDAYCWGDGSEGLLGDGSTSIASTPVQVAGGHDFVRLTAAISHTCGLLSDATAVCWGQGFQGTLGSGSSDDSFTPVAVDGGPTFSQIEAGSVASCGVRTDNVTLCWGNGIFGQLGNGQRGSRPAGDDCLNVYCEESPFVVPNAPDFVDVAVNFGWACGIEADGRQHCWGGSGAEMAPYATTWNDVVMAAGAINVASPLLVSDQPRLASLTGYSGVVCGLDTAGVAYCWGAVGGEEGEAKGSLGDGTYDSSRLPVAVAGGRSYSGLSISGAYLGAGVGGTNPVCGVTTDNRAFCWGAAWLSDGTLAAFTAPTEVPST